MLNFRFHIVSLVAVFLALAIGVIMGSTVIDRALVDTLEDQQQALRADLDQTSEENAALRRELDELRDVGNRLAEEGGARLLDGTLDEVPVLLVAVRGVDEDAIGELGELLSTAGARDLGTLWLTGRLALEDDETLANLRGVLGMGDGSSPQGLRSAVVRRVADDLRRNHELLELASLSLGEVAEVESPEVGAADMALLSALADAGFVDFEAPDGGPDDVVGVVVPGMRVIVVSGPGAGVPDAELAAPLARALVNDSATVAPPLPVLAAEVAGQEGAEDPPELVRLIRTDEVQDRVSTVDNVGSFAGRLAAVVATEDLGAGRRGHYGVGPGAQRLVPSPAG